jgi:hypothetical protein
MTSTVCRAKNPSSCQYHGTSASSNTRVLRDTMNVARSVYKAASPSEQFEAYYNLQDAEEAYYGTDEGRASLIATINSNVDSPNRNHWLGILERADKKREFIETQMATLADKQNPEHKISLPFNHNMKVEEYGGRKYVALANGSYSDGREYSFDWDQTSGQVVYEEKDDLDSMRTLGVAKDIGTAKNVCENWYKNIALNTAN